MNKLSTVFSLAVKSILIFAVNGMAVLGVDAQMAGNGSVAISIQARGKTTIGRTVVRSKQRIAIFRRDGRLVEYAVDEIAHHDPLATFEPYSSLRLQNHYQKLFGGQYQVSRTAHYVVVHPQGKRQKWADPFEELFGRFQHYFQVRGFPLLEPEFPLVVVVFATRGEFNQVAREAGVKDPNQVVGYYSPVSNWICTFEQDGIAHENGWDENRATLIHESLHQYAFNVGIHQRLGACPRWCTEGLATMFEADGVNDSLHYRNEKDRLHPAHLPVLQQYLRETATHDTIDKVIGDDRLFEEDMQLAYAVSWGLAYYLSETRQRQFNEYLQKTADRSIYAPGQASDRQASFMDAFGNNLTLLDSHFKAFILSK